MTTDVIRILISLGFYAVGLTVIIATIRNNQTHQSRRLERIDATIHNGLSEHMARTDQMVHTIGKQMDQLVLLPERISALEARCAE